MSTNAFDIVPTKAMLLKGNQAADFKVTVFDGSKVKEKPNYKEIKNHKRQIEEEIRKQNSDDDIFGMKRPKKVPTKENENQVSLKRATKDVLNLGISGFGAKTKAQLQIEKAIRLGAKKPKPTYKNYKEILEEKKLAKIKDKEQSEFQQLGKNKMGFANIRYTGKSTKKSINLKKRDKKMESIDKNYGVVKKKFKKNKQKGE